MDPNVTKIRKVFGHLVHQCRWVGFNMTWDEERQKYSKKPVNPYTGGYAKSNDPRTWGTFDKALHYMNNHTDIAGVMIVLIPDDDLVGIDIDGCWDEEVQQWNPVAQEIINLANSYTEVSPSGKGIRIMLQGKLPPGKRKNSQNGVEMYDYGRFLTITGNHVAGTPEEICRRDEAISTIHSTYLGSQPQSLFKENIADKLPRSTIIDDEDILDLAINSTNGDMFESLYEGGWEDDYGSQSEADLALCCMLAFWTGWRPEQMDRIFRSSELYRDKWDKRHYGDGRTYGQGLIQKAIEFTDQCYLQDAGWEDICNE